MNNDLLMEFENILLEIENEKKEKEKSIIEKKNVIIETNIEITDNEKEIINFIKEKYNKEIVLKYKENNLEYDLYFPDLNLAIDYNELEYHNELHKDKKFHLSKTEEAEKNNIKLIHIYEDDWNNKKDIIKSRLLNSLNVIPIKIFGRKCKIREIPEKESKIISAFLKENHMQGMVGSKIKIGLYYNNELVSLMTFGERRVAMGVKKNADGEYEMLRFCNKLNVNVIGGASKLFQYFLKTYNPRVVTTYADRSWSNGDLYIKLGFTYLYKTEPNYYYVVDNVRKHRFNFRKDVLIKQGFDGSKTEIQIMHDRGLYRIFDSGNIKFEYLLKNE
jgi:hypothetical protein